MTNDKDKQHGRWDVQLVIWLVGVWHVQPSFDGQYGLQAMEDALALERFVNQKLLDLHGVADTAGDAHVRPTCTRINHPLQSHFLHRILSRHLCIYCQKKYRDKNDTGTRTDLMNVFLINWNFEKICNNNNIYNINTRDRDFLPGFEVSTFVNKFDVIIQAIHHFWTIK